MLTYLVVGTNVSPSTRNQILAAVLFRFEHLLEQPLDRTGGVVQVHKPMRLPVVLARDEVQAILAELDGAPRLACKLPDGSGLRLVEGLGLRVKDLDFAREAVIIPGGASMNLSWAAQHSFIRVRLNKSSTEQLKNGNECHDMPIL